MDIDEMLGMVAEYERKIEELLDETLTKANSVPPEMLGLDPRSARRVWLAEDGLFVHAGDDRVMQYYGGFEYVDKSCRKAYGHYVFYSADDERVWGHLDTYRSNLETEENVTDGTTRSHSED